MEKYREAVHNTVVQGAFSNLLCEVGSEGPDGGVAQATWYWMQAQAQGW
jgi:hypothetical protein